jgi:hypothetical protein
LDNKKLAELLFPQIDKTPEYYEEMYPERNLPEGARVTRFAPSPTGYLHIGGLFSALVDVLTAQTTNGVSFLRTGISNSLVISIIISCNRNTAVESDAVALFIKALRNINKKLFKFTLVQEFL